MLKCGSSILDPSPNSSKPIYKIAAAVALAGSGDERVRIAIKEAADETAYGPLKTALEKAAEGELDA